MDTLKGQGNILKKLCSENRCEIMIVTHNLTNKFQPLDLTVNKAAKAFIQNKCNDWFSNQVAHQLKSSKDPTNIKISPKLSDLKLLHADWIVNLRNYMPGECETIVKGFKEASIVKTIKDSDTIYERVKNPFRSQSIFS